MTPFLDKAFDQVGSDHASTTGDQNVLSLHPDAKLGDNRKPVRQIESFFLFPRLERIKESFSGSDMPKEASGINEGFFA